jgi:hypothetical protein
MSLKWDTSDPGVHRSSCGKYCTVRATAEPPNWIAYRLGPTTGVELGSRPDSAAARGLCEQDARAVA